MKMQEMTYDEFKKFHDKNEILHTWNFNLFKIICNKCASSVVEIAGKCDTESGYYGDVNNYGGIIVKCHSCGNAMVINLFNWAGNTFLFEEENPINSDAFDELNEEDILNKNEKKSIIANNVLKEL